ncbi:MAG: hypothetical protein JXQ23_14145 [Clostridia bacterium]|nr:hypothetical protein [Clostridia bacterium]
MSEKKNDVKDNIETGEETKLKNGSFIMKLLKMFNFMKKKEKENEEEYFKESSTKNEDGEDEEDTVKIKIPFKEIAIVLVLSVLLAFIIIFILDLAGWRSSLRNNITTKLLGVEKQLLTDQLEYEYQTKLEEEKATLLSAERANLVVEYQALEDSRNELDKREKALAKNEEELNQKIETLKLEQDQLSENISDFENAVLEVSELGKIYGSMEPKNAASILTAMPDENLMLKILKSMKSDEIAGILELMETTKAADIISKLN